jgi:hypothetical protein
MGAGWYGTQDPVQHVTLKAAVWLGRDWSTHGIHGESGVADGRVSDRVA